VTGRKTLFVNRGSTTRWQPNSVAFCDKRATRHHALFNYFPHRRYGLRATVEGDKPFYRA
jgi:taurine dioxygenase